jgi:hypothetical protein
VRVLFLDFDGVLLNRACWREPLKVKGKAATPNPELVARLAEIVRRTGARIVVSSTWRVGRTADELTDILHAAGLPGSERVLDVTPYGVDGRHVERGVEIRHWMAQRDDVESFVVLDDDDDRANITRFRWVLTKFETGLQDEHVELAVRALMHPCGPLVTA